MDYIIFTKNTSINDWINRCLSIINHEDALKFKKKIRDIREDDNQSLHFFRELILGAYLISKDIAVRYNCKTLGKTPDWTIIDKDTSDRRGIIEVVNLDIDDKSKKYTENQRNKNEFAVNWTGSNKDRLYKTLEDKASIYKDLLLNKPVPYVCAVFVDFDLYISSNTVNDLLNDNTNGLFQINNRLSGVLYFYDGNRKYYFKYFENDKADNKIRLPTGELFFDHE